MTLCEVEMHNRLALFLVIVSGACTGEVEGDETPDAGVVPDARNPGLAPDDLVDGEIPLADGPNTVDVPASSEAVYRIETEPGQHVAFRLDFDPALRGIKLYVDRWDGAAPVMIGVTDAGPGLRVLAVVDQALPRTFWVRVTAGDAALAASLTVTRTPFTEGVHCEADCAHLLQLPLANDPAVDGYTYDSNTIFRYQFGRRDLLMMTRESGRRMAAAGKQPFVPHDYSQWDSETPGTDTGSLRHLSHQRGKDVDISLYGSDGGAFWRSFCDVQPVDGGTECVPGTRRGYDPYWNARMYAPFLESGRVTMSFLDDELIAVTVPAADDAVADGSVDAAIAPLYGDGKHLQHWPNHHHHIHVRVSEVEGKIAGDPPFEAP